MLVSFASKTWQEGSRSTIILFDWMEKQIKIGIFPWRKLRLVKATIQFDGLELELDKAFLENFPQPAGVPGLEAYGSQETDGEDQGGSPAHEAEQNGTEQDLAANGMVMVAVPPAPGQEDLACMMLVPVAPCGGEVDMSTEVARPKDDLETALESFILEET